MKGVLELEYFGGAEVIKLSNAVPASLVMDVSGQSSYSFNSDSERGQITDSRLAELGLSLRVENGHGAERHDGVVVADERGKDGAGGRPGV